MRWPNCGGIRGGRGGELPSRLTRFLPGLPRVAQLRTPQASQGHPECPGLSPAISEELRRARDVVHHVRIQIAREIVVAEAPRPEIMQRAELPFQMQIHVEVIRKAPRI